MIGLEKQKIRLRQAVASDAETIAALHTESWRSSYRGILPDHFLEGSIVGHQKKQWADKLNPDSQHRIFVKVAEQENCLVAFVCVLLDKEAGWGAELDNLHVQPHLKGQGLGKQLMSEAATWVLEQRVDTMYLWVFEDNHPARAFYDKLNGQVIERKMMQISGNPEKPLLRYVWRELNKLKEML
jgi:GNAT superfamily N-acetyltransferase